MRFVFLSDTHGVTLQHPVPAGDVLVHCGDFSKKGTEKELIAFRTWFFSFPHAIKIFVAGNHDLMFENDPVQARSLVDGGTYLLDQNICLDGINVYGSPWTPEFYSWAFMRPRGKPMQEIWDQIPAQVDVLVTHGPPRGVLDFVPGSQTFVGCEDLASAVNRIKPTLHVFGHIHEGYGTKVLEWEDGSKTLCINASICNLGAAGINRPVVVDVVKETAAAKSEAFLVE